MVATSSELIQHLDIHDSYEVEASVKYYDIYIL